MIHDLVELSFCGDMIPGDSLVAEMRYRFT